MSNSQPDICFFIGGMKFAVDNERNLRPANGANNMVFGRFAGFVDPENEQNTSSWPVSGWQVIIANKSGKEFTFDQVVTVVLNRRGLGDQRRESRPVDHEQRHQRQNRRQHPVKA